MSMIDPTLAYHALSLCWIALRNELRALAESGANATLTTPPREGMMDRWELDHAAELITALRATAEALPKCPPDQHPAWLDDVTAGLTKL